MKINSMELSKNTGKFKITPIKSGIDTKKPSIVIVHGFLSESQSKYEQELLMLKNIGYDDSDIYVVQWGSKSIANFFDNLLKTINNSLNINMTIKNTKFTHSKLIKIGAHILLFIIKSWKTWKDAVENSEDTGLKLANYLMTDKVFQGKELILIGHSLGARIIIKCLNKLYEQKYTAKNIVLVHLLGAATPNTIEWWQYISKVVNGKIYNHYSGNDSVLFYIFQGAQLLMEKPAGLTGAPENYGIENKKCDFGHLEYFQKLDQIISI